MTEHTVVKGPIFGFDSEGERWAVGIKFTTVDTSPDVMKQIAIGICYMNHPHITWAKVDLKWGGAWTQTTNLIKCEKVSEPMEAEVGELEICPVPE